jgi:hypothetical protein
MDAVFLWSMECYGKTPYVEYVDDNEEEDEDEEEGGGGDDDDDDSEDT